MSEVCYFSLMLWFYLGLMLTGLWKRFLSSSYPKPNLQAWLTTERCCNFHTPPPPVFEIAMGLQSCDMAANSADFLWAEVSRRANLGWAFSTIQAFQRSSEIKISTCCSPWGGTPSTTWELCQGGSGSQFGSYWPKNSRKNLIRLYSREKERYWI